MTFTTPSEFDRDLLSQNIDLVLRNAVNYRLAQKVIMENQKKMLGKLKDILTHIVDGHSIDNHLSDKSIDEIKSVYPLRDYLKTLKSNINLSGHQ